MMDLIKRFIQNFILFQILFCFIYCNDVHAQAEDNKIFHDIEIINPVDAKNTEQKMKIYLKMRMCQLIMRI